MDSATYEAEKHRLALINAQLDAKLKEADITEKTKPWKTLASPTTLMALLSALIALTSAAVTMLQFWGNKDDAAAQRASAELTAERVLVQNVMQQAGSDEEQLRRKITGLIAAGMLPLTENGLIRAGMTKIKASAE